jgi:hypothetical protein
MDYTTLSLAQVSAGLDEIARDVRPTFGGLTRSQLNWKPDAARWSVAQCLQHLVTANERMLQAAEERLSGARPPTLWQRAPLLPGLFGPMLVRSQAPTNTRKFKAPPSARPAASEIGAEVIDRFVDQHRAAVQRAQALDEGAAARAIMSSPFVPVVIYSVLDGWRLMLPHDRRHFEQARRVMSTPGFPTA